MTAEKLLLLFAAAVCAGVKSIYGVNAWRERKTSFKGIWRSKYFYGLSGIWCLFYLLVWIAWGQSMLSVRVADLCCTYILLAVVDGKRKIVPDEVLAVYFIGQMLLGTADTLWRSLLHTTLTGVIFTVILFAVTRIVKGKMGLGDVKLLGITAMTAGWLYTLQILIWGMVLSFLYSMGLLFIGKKSMQTEFPFVPFLAAGIGIQMIW